MELVVIRLDRSASTNYTNFI